MDGLLLVLALIIETCLSQADVVRRAVSSLREEDRR